MVRQLYLWKGEIDVVREFLKTIQGRFKVRKAIVDDVVTFEGRDIAKVRNGVHRMEMEKYMHFIEYVDIQSSRRKYSNESATKGEKKSFRSLAGELTWLGSVVMPHDSYFASHMQKKLPQLRAVQETVDVDTFYDAAFNVSKSSKYGQTRFITSICFADEFNTYHPVNW